MATKKSVRRKLREMFAPKTLEEWYTDFCKKHPLPEIKQKNG